MNDKIEDTTHTLDLGESNRLFLDPSSSCLGYAIAHFSRETCTIVRAGALWLPDSWTHAQKYFYIQEMITNDFYVTNAVTDIIYEKYMFSPKTRQGSLVVPEMIGAIKASSVDIGSEALGIEDIAPTEWRKHIGLVPDKTPMLDKAGNQVCTEKGTPKWNKDYKEPMRRIADEHFPGQIPKTLKSNITGKDRNMPNDLTDALGVCICWHKKLGIKKFILKPNALNNAAEGL